VETQIEEVGKRVLKRMRHREPARTLASRISSKYDVRFGQNPSIGTDVDLRGHIRTGDHVTINDGASLYREVELADHVKVDQDAVVYGPAEFGRHTNVLSEVRIRADLSVGGFTAIAHAASIQSFGLSLGRVAGQQDFQQYLGNQNPAKKRPIEIGNDCYIGSDAVIAPGVSIGDSALHV
jgi:acetyltransferase-like isoleucine patch superfamily enzyme